LEKKQIRKYKMCTFSEYEKALDGNEQNEVLPLGC
jgi:hypothetical protein